MQEIRQVRKTKKDTDTCRDCWTQRFRKDLYDYFRSLVDSPGNSSISLNEFLAREFKTREKRVEKLRAEATDIYDEITEIKAFAGDLYMDPAAIPTDKS
jgi:hypothetical protein